MIVFESIDDDGYKYIKRVIGLPGETIQIQSGSIFINGEYLHDPFNNGILEAYSAKHEILLGDDEYFVLGDNREESIDSRDFSFGNVARNKIVGKIK